MAASVEPLVRDGWRFLSNRSATLTLNGNVWTVRSPFIGELEHLADLYDNAFDSQQEVLATFDRRHKELTAEVEAQALTIAEAERQVRALRRELDRSIRQGWWSVLRSLCDLLADKPLPPDEELPGWLATSAAEQLGALFGHFRSCPDLPRPGGSAQAVS